MLSKFQYLAFIIVVFSCKHSETPKPQNSSQNCQVTEFQLSGMNTYAETYVYNEQSNLKEIRSSNGGIIESNNEGQIKSIDWQSNTPEFFYDIQGRIKKMVVPNTVPSGFGYTYTFYEYDSKGHLSQKTWFPWGSDELSALYNPDFKIFVAAVVSKYSSMTNSWEQEKFMEQMELTICTKYLVDERNLTVTEIRSMLNRSLINRVEEVWTVTNYDGKNNPYRSAEWRPITMYSGELSLKSDLFPELGNALEKTSKFTDFSWNNYKRSYVYNSDGYPESGTYADSYSKINLTWKYNCK